jgi:hypothetical protein
MSILSETTTSKSLFTFTSELKYLVDMIEFGITPRYVFETMPYGQKSYIIPMKCFCDIPLSKAKMHMNWFGKYGLGINKNYLAKMGVTPVLYIHHRSRINLFKDFRKNNEINKLVPVLKRYKGRDFRKNIDGGIERKIRQFYEEREWRYIPKNCQIISVNVSKIEDGLEIAHKMNIDFPYYENTILLDPSFIEYIIVRDKRDIPELRNQLRKLYTEDEKFEAALMKIIISTQIFKDF